MKKIKFMVYGTPVPKGSYRAFTFKTSRYPVITNDNPKTKQWERVIASEALNHRPEEGLIDEPINVTLCFYMPRPKSKPKEIVYPYGKPDIDKLARSTLDALKEILFTDDARVCDLNLKKRYAKTPEDTRVEIQVEGIK